MQVNEMDRGGVTREAVAGGFSIENRRETEFGRGA